MRLLTTKRLIFAIVAAIAVLSIKYAFASDIPGETAGGGGDSSEVLEVLVALVFILLVAKLGGDLFERISQPAVLGELVMGMVIGNLHLFGLDMFEPFKHDITLEILAELGVIILLFEVGLETTVKEMLNVGLASFMVAVFGVTAPFFLGWAVGLWFLPEASTLVHIFIGATLTATSVGITARVLKDIGKIRTKEAKIILGAAVIDDILGLIILAVVTGVITATSTGAAHAISSGAILWIIAKAFLFIIGSVILGGVVLPQYFKFGFKLKGSGVLLSFSLMVCFLMAFIAGEIGLAPIVGAFAAGLIFEDVHYKDFRDRGDHQLEELIQPIAIFLVPVFFVRMGMLVDLKTFTHVEILGFAAAMTIVAIAGKQICALAIFEKGINRLAIGLGMVPRGEVGLIFAGIGARLMLDGEPVISVSTYSAVVIMVIVTTLVTPPALKYVLLRPGETDSGESAKAEPVT